MNGRIVLTTCSAADEAQRIAEELVNTRLAACVNIVPGVQSVYRWQGAVVKEQELLLLIKTSAERLPALEETLLGLHSYETPEFVVLAAEHISPGYAAWLEENLGGWATKPARSFRTT